MTGWSVAALAHPEWSPIRVNRYDKIVLAEPGRVRLVYTLLYGDGPALPARKSVDADANGRIDEREKAMLGARAQAQVAAGLQLTLDGYAVRLDAPKIDVGMAGDAVAPEPFSVDLTYLIDAPASAPHTLVIDDRVQVPSEGDTEVSLDEPAPAQLLAAYQGRAPGPQPVRVFTFRGPRFSVLEDRSVKVRWLGAGGVVRAHARSRAVLVAAGAGIALGVIAIALAIARRRQRRE